MEEKISGRPHRLMMEDRGKMSMTGIVDVISFDEDQVVLDTDKGLLTIKGKDLCVSRLTLDKGEVDVDGQADSLVYSSNVSLRRSGESRLSRLFR